MPKKPLMLFSNVVSENSTLWHKPSMEIGQVTHHAHTMKQDIYIEIMFWLAYVIMIVAGILIVEWTIKTFLVFFILYTVLWLFIKITIYLI